jgi:hypothetical protein
MKHDNDENIKIEDGIRILMRKYAEWKEKRELSPFNDEFEHYIPDEQEFLDFDKEF